MVTERRVLNCREVEAEYDGLWLLYDQRDFPPADDMGYVVAYGDGTAEDREALCDINHKMFNGEVLLKKGWVPRDDYIDSGVIEAL